MAPPRPFRVLHVVPSYWPATAYGGPIESVHGLCVAEARAGARVDVLTTDADGDRNLEMPRGREVRPAERLRVRYCRRWAGDSIAPGLLVRLPAEIARSEIVHLTAVYSFPTIPALILSRFLRKPVVWSTRGSLQAWERSSRPRLKGIWRRVCAALVPARTVLHVTSEEEAVASRSAFSGLETLVIPNGVDVPAAIPRPPKDGPTHLVFLGRLHPIKAIENLIDACAICARQGWGEWRLSIAGGGDAEYEASLRSRAGSAGIAPRVTFLGPVHGARKTELLLSADAVVVPSHSENFSMVVVEALAHGVPVVASTGTPWSALPERRCGWWVENRPDALAATLFAVRDSDVEEMGRRGREWMLADFRWDAIAARMLAAYDGLVAGAGAARSAHGSLPHRDE